MTVMARPVRLSTTFLSNERKRGYLKIKGGMGDILIVYCLRTTKVHNSLNFTLFYGVVILIARKAHINTEAAGGMTKL